MNDLTVEESFDKERDHQGENSQRTRSNSLEEVTEDLEDEGEKFDDDDHEGVTENADDSGSENNDEEEEEDPIAETNGEEERLGFDPSRNTTSNEAFSNYYTGKRPSLPTSYAKRSTTRSYAVENAHFLIYLYENNKELLTETSINYFENSQSSDQETRRNLAVAAARALLNNGVTPGCNAQNHSNIDSNEDGASEIPPPDPILFESPNLGPIFLTYLSNYKTYTTRKRKRKFSSKDRIRLAAAAHNTKRTALSYMLRQFNVPSNVYYQLQECLTAGLKILKEKIIEEALAAANVNGEEDSDSDVEMTAESYSTLYVHICEWFLEERREGLFAYAFTVLTWNLGLPCGITSRIQLQHISMSSNGSAIKIHVSSLPDSGTKSKVCMLYSNPYNPLICPFFALSIFIMAHPGIVSQSESSYLFSNTSNGDEEEGKHPSSFLRFNRFLDRVVTKHRQEIYKLCDGLDANTINASTIHAGSTCVLNHFAETGGATGDDLMNDESDRVSSITRSKDYPSMPSFEYKGRVLAGLDPEQPDFQVWPPRFDIRNTSAHDNCEDNDLLRPFWTGIFGATELPGLQSVLCSLSACILYHYHHNQNFVKSFATRYNLEFVMSNPLFYAGLDTPDVVTKLRLPHVGPSPDIIHQRPTTASCPIEGQLSLTQSGAVVDELIKKVNQISKRMDQVEKTHNQLSSSFHSTLKNVAGEIRTGVRDEIRQYKETERNFAYINASMQGLTNNGVRGRAAETGVGATILGAGDGATTTAGSGAGTTSASGGGNAISSFNLAAGPFIRGAISPDSTALYHLILAMMSQMEGRLNRFEERLVTAVSCAAKTRQTSGNNESDEEDATTDAKQGKNAIATNGGMYYHETATRGLSPVPDGWTYPKEFPVRHLFSRWFLPDIQNRLCPLRLLKPSDVCHLKGRDGRQTMVDAQYIMRVFENRLRQLGLLKDNHTPTGGDVAEWWQQCQGVVMDKISQCTKISRARRSRLNEKNFRQIKESYCEALKHESRSSQSQE